MDDLVAIAKDEVVNGRKPRHGHARKVGRTPTYRAWQCMIARVTNPNIRHYERYGGRDIKVCERWRNSFENFLADMGVRPSSRHSLDRIDNDGNYEPANCRWATQSEQMRNTVSNRLITCRGETHCVAEWSVISGTDDSTITRRLELGADPERAIFGARQPGRSLAKPPLPVEKQQIANDVRERHKSVEVKVGQVWQDWDSRFRHHASPRTMRVISIDERNGKARCLNSNGRMTSIRLDRFKPTGSGYRLLEQREREKAEIDGRELAT